MGLFGPDLLTKELTTEVRALRADIADLKVEREAATKERDLSKTVVELQTEIATLTADRSKIEEEYERQEREVRHEVGLLRKQTEAEVEMAKTEAVLAVREENLANDRERFETQMKFTTERFEKEIGYLRDIMRQVMERLPTIEVSKRINEGTPVNGHAAEDA